jgi:hypothetical protein
MKFAGGTHEHSGSRVSRCILGQPEGISLPVSVQKPSHQHIPEAASQRINSRIQRLPGLNYRTFEHLPNAPVSRAWFQKEMYRDLPRRANQPILLHQRQSTNSRANHPTTASFPQRTVETSTGHCIAGSLLSVTTRSRCAVGARSLVLVPEIESRD